MAFVDGLQQQDTNHLNFESRAELTKNNIFWDLLHQRAARFGAIDFNRKAAVIVFSAFSATRMRWKALVLAFVSRCYG